MQYSKVHHQSFQLYSPKPHLEIQMYIEICSYFPVHMFGILFLHIFKTQIQFSILNLSIHVG